MKRVLVNFSAIVAALIIGLTINNACAEKIDSDNPEEAPVAARFFFEDGLLFGPDGRVYNKLKSVTGNPRIEDVITHFYSEISVNYTTDYTYDSKGRLAKIFLTANTAYGRLSLTVTYSYSKLRVNQTYEWTWGSDQSSRGAATCEYYNMEQE